MQNCPIPKVLPRNCSVKITPGLQIRCQVTSARPAEATWQWLVRELVRKGSGLLLQSFQELSTILMALPLCDSGPDRKKLGGKKGLPQLTVTVYHVGSQARNSRQEPGGRRWSRGHRGILLPGLHSLLFYTLRTTCPGMASPYCVGPFYTNH